MASLKFQYTPGYSDEGIKRIPLVDVLFTNPENGTSLNVQCLIDSGADEIILPAEAALMLGIVFKFLYGKRIASLVNKPINSLTKRPSVAAVADEFVVLGTPDVKESRLLEESHILRGSMFGSHILGLR